jgi:hypothetical protein
MKELEGNIIVKVEVSQGEGNLRFSTDQEILVFFMQR